MTRYRLEIVSGFDAAHHLRAYRGAPEATHGHSFRVVVALDADALDAEGIAFDFVEARRALDALASRFDHGDVNTVAPFDVESPTAERLAAWFCEELQRRLPAARVASATVWEGPWCSATYFAESRPIV